MCNLSAGCGELGGPGDIIRLWVLISSVVWSPVTSSDSLGKWCQSECLVFTCENKWTALLLGKDHNVSSWRGPRLKPKEVIFKKKERVSLATNPVVK